MSSHSRGKRLIAEIGSFGCVERLCFFDKSEGDFENVLPQDVNRFYGESNRKQPFK